MAVNGNGRSGHDQRTVAPVGLQRSNELDDILSDLLRDNPAEEAAVRERTLAKSWGTKEREFSSPQGCVSTQSDGSQTVLTWQTSRDGPRKCVTVSKETIKRPTSGAFTQQGAFSSPARSTDERSLLDIADGRRFQGPPSYKESRTLQTHTETKTQERVLSPVFRNPVNTDKSRVPPAPPNRRRVLSPEITSEGIVRSDYPPPSQGVPLHQKRSVSGYRNYASDSEETLTWLEEQRRKLELKRSGGTWNHRKQQHHINDRSRSSTDFTRSGGGAYSTRPVYPQTDPDDLATKPRIQPLKNSLSVDSLDGKSRVHPRSPDPPRFTRDYGDPSSRFRSLESSNRRADDDRARDDRFYRVSSIQRPSSATPHYKYSFTMPTGVASSSYDEYWGRRVRPGVSAPTSPVIPARGFSSRDAVVRSKGRANEWIGVSENATFNRLDEAEQLLRNSSGVHLTAPLKPPQHMTADGQSPPSPFHPPTDSVTVSVLMIAARAGQECIWVPADTELISLQPIGPGVRDLEPGGTIDGTWNFRRSTPTLNKGDYTQKSQELRSQSSLGRSTQLVSPATQRRDLTYATLPINTAHSSALVDPAVFAPLPQRPLTSLGQSTPGGDLGVYQAQRRIHSTETMQGSLAGSGQPAFDVRQSGHTWSSTGQQATNQKMVNQQWIQQQPLTQQQHFSQQEMHYRQQVQQQQLQRQQEQQQLLLQEQQRVLQQEEQRQFQLKEQQRQLQLEQQRQLQEQQRQLQLQEQQKLLEQKLEQQRQLQLQEQQRQLQLQEQQRQLQLQEQQKLLEQKLEQQRQLQLQEQQRQLQLQEQQRQLQQQQEEQRQLQLQEQQRLLQVQQEQKRQLQLQEQQRQLQLQEQQMQLQLQEQQMQLQKQQEQQRQLQLQEQQMQLQLKEQQRQLQLQEQQMQLQLKEQQMQLQRQQEQQRQLQQQQYHSQTIQRTYVVEHKTEPRHPFASQTLDSRVRETSFSSAQPVTQFASQETFKETSLVEPHRSTRSDVVVQADSSRLIEQGSGNVSSQYSSVQRGVQGSSGFQAVEVHGVGANQVGVQSTGGQVGLNQAGVQTTGGQVGLNQVQTTGGQVGLSQAGVQSTGGQVGLNQVGRQVIERRYVVEREVITKGHGGQRVGLKLSAGQGDVTQAGGQTTTQGVGAGQGSYQTTYQGGTLTGTQGDAYQTGMVEKNTWVQSTTGTQESQQAAQAGGQTIHGIGAGQGSYQAAYQGGTLTGTQGSASQAGAMEKNTWVQGTSGTQDTQQSSTTFQQQEVRFGGDEMDGGGVGKVLPITMESERVEKVSMETGGQQQQQQQSYAYGYQQVGDHRSDGAEWTLKGGGVGVNEGRSESFSHQGIGSINPGGSWTLRPEVGRSGGHQRNASGSFVDRQQVSPMFGLGRTRTASATCITDGAEWTHHQSPRFVRDTSRHWHKPNITRDDAINLLLDKEPGSFVVRNSSTFPGSFGLALKVSQVPPNMQTKGGDPQVDLIRHFLIEPTPKGVRLKGCSNEPVFASLSALIYQHSVTPLSLPCKLKLPSEDIDVLDGSIGLSGSDSNGAACTVLYMSGVETENLTGPEALARSIKELFESGRPLPRSTIVQLKVTKDGITLTDNRRRIFFRRFYPIQTITFCGVDPRDRRWTVKSEDLTISGKAFGFVARKPGVVRENACHIFLELDSTQPANIIVNFVTKVLIGQGQRLLQ